MARKGGSRVEAALRNPSYLRVAQIIGFKALDSNNDVDAIEEYIEKNGDPYQNALDAANRATEQVRKKSIEDLSRLTRSFESRIAEMNRSFDTRYGNLQQASARRERTLSDTLKAQSNDFNRRLDEANILLQNTTEGFETRLENQGNRFNRTINTYKGDLNKSWTSLEALGIRFEDAQRRYADNFAKSQEDFTERFQRQQSNSRKELRDQRTRFDNRFKNQADDYNKRFENQTNRYEQQLTDLTGAYDERLSQQDARYSGLLEDQAEEFAIQRNDLKDLLVGAQDKNASLQGLYDEQIRVAKNQSNAYVPDANPGARRATAGDDRLKLFNNVRGKAKTLSQLSLLSGLGAQGSPLSGLNIA